MKQRDYSAGISGCHYAVRNSIGSLVMNRLPGAVRLTRRPSPEGRNFLVRDDNGSVYSYAHSPKEKERHYTLEIVSLTKTFLTDVLGFVENEDGSLTEGIAGNVHISLFYETENGGRPVRHRLYDCVVSPPTFDVQTLGETLSADTRKLELTANPDPHRDGAYSTQIARADNAQLFDSWFGLKGQI